MKKYLLMTSILMSSLIPVLAEATTSNLDGNVVFDSSINKGTPETSELKKIVENSFKVVTDMKARDEDYAQYVSKNYVQHVDGETLNYDGFIAHMKALKKAIKSVKIVFHDMIVEGTKVVTRHTAYAVKNDSQEIEVQVIAIFELKNGKIISCNELTHLVKGEKADRDIGSRQ